MNGIYFTEDAWKNHEDLPDYTIRMKDKRERI